MGSKMIGCGSDTREAGASKEKPPWIQHGVLVAMCALVVGIYAYSAHSGFLESLSLNPADAYYNSLVQGFRSGQLNLKREVPSGLRQLVDPYDPSANAPYWFAPHWGLDLSYYKGKLYLYFGVTPALILFWPFVAVTGHFLFDRQAATIFCAIGFLASAGLLRGLWRRYFAEVGVGVVAVCTLALGLATGVPLLLSRAEVYEVSISCGYVLTMLAWGAIWCALHEPERRARWLTAASVAYGLAVGARPSLLFGAVILLVPVAHAWRTQRRAWFLLLAAVGPITLIGCGLLLYNCLRFDSPFEFGWRYQLAGQRQDLAQRFSLHYLWFNFRLCFLEPAQWSGRFPFIDEIVVPPRPPGYGHVETPFGVLTNIPLVWLALAVPLAWRGRSAEARSMLRGFVAAVALLFGICALTLCLFYAACFRYEVEFLPALVLLAVVGILGLERTLAPTPESGQTGRSLWRHVVRWGWVLLLGYSTAFNVLAAVERYTKAGNDRGIALERTGRLQEAVAQYEQVLQIRPGYPEAHNNLGLALERAGRIPEAIAHYEQALRLKPYYPDPYYNLGIALERSGRLQEAVACYEQVLRLRPTDAEAHNGLGSALVGLGRVPEAIGHWEQAVRLKPEYAEAHNNLGSALLGLGKVPEAVEQYDQAVRLKPDYAKAHCNLAIALERAGRAPEAVIHYERALQLNPDFAEARTRLERLRVAR